MNLIKMWARFKTSFSKKDKLKIQSYKTLNVNDEYLCAVRTKSFADFFLKFKFSSEVLLEPCQETIKSLLESSSLFPNKSSSSSSKLKPLLSNYFNISAEASNFCTKLLKSLNQLQADYNNFIRQLIDAIDLDDNYSSDKFTKLRTNVILNNPLSNLNFNYLHERHSSVLQQLKSNKKKVARKIKMIKIFNGASGLCITAACGVLAAAAMFLTMHAFTALLMGPAILSFPSFRFFKSGFLRKVVEQLDVAAKGAYILNRDFDTMSRLVTRLQDEIEHKKGMIELCLERRVCLQVLKEIKKYEFGFSKQVEELEEHVYLCLVTINRARALVVKEICKQNSV